MHSTHTSRDYSTEGSRNENIHVYAYKAVHVCIMVFGYLVFGYLFIDQKDKERERARLSRDGEGRAPLMSVPLMD